MRQLLNNINIMLYIDWIAIHFNSGFINMTKFKFTALLFVFCFSYTYLFSLFFLIIFCDFNILLVFMYHLDTMLKRRNITLPTKAHLVKAMVFPVVMCGCESWTIKKAEHRGTDAFEL